jgi:hypothetical protein
VKDLKKMSNSHNELVSQSSSGDTGVGLNRSPVVLAGPIDWSSISGRDRLDAWLGLAEFVECIVRRYNLALELRPCWWQHGDAVEELTALWQIRLFSYRVGAKPTEGMTWQDMLYKSRGRLRDIFVSCGNGHIDPSVDIWMTEDVATSFQRLIGDECR